MPSYLLCTRRGSWFAGVGSRCTVKRGGHGCSGVSGGVSSESTWAASPTERFVVSSQKLEKLTHGCAAWEVV